MKAGEAIISLAAAIVAGAIVIAIVQSPNSSKVISATGQTFIGAVRAMTGR
jgi:hypothetical protein